MQIVTLCHKNPASVTGGRNKALSGLCLLDIKALVGTQLLCVGGNLPP